MADYRYIIDALAIYFGFISSILQINYPYKTIKWRVGPIKLAIANLADQLSGGRRGTTLVSPTQF